MLNLTEIISAIGAEQTNYPFRPVKCKQSDLEKQVPINGFLYFTIDSHKIYYGNNGEYIPMGGTSGVYYGMRPMTDDEKYGDQIYFNFYSDNIDSITMPTIDDLILNIPDGGFYRVVNTNVDYVEGQRLMIAGGGGTGGSGTGGASGSLMINYITPRYSTVLAGVEYEIEFEIDAKDSAGDTIAEAGIATWKINGKQYTQKVYNGKNSFKVHEYLNSAIEQNTIVLLVNMDVDGMYNILPVSKTWYVKAINLTLDWPWTYSEQEYRSDDYFTLKFYPYGNIACKAHISFDEGFELNKNYFIEDITADKTGKEYTTSPMKSLEYGSHSCDIWLVTTINDIDYSTKPIRHEITFIKGGTSTILTVPYYITTATQYDTVNIPFLAYDPDTAKCNISFYVNDVRVSGDAYDRTLQSWPYTLTDFGTVRLSLRSDNGDTFKDIELIVNKRDIPHTEASGAAFSLKATNFSSNDELRNWNSNGVTLTFSDNFDWNRGGIDFETLDDGSIEKFIRVRQGTRMWINYKLFEKFTTGTSGGKNFKFCFKATNCYDYEAPVLNCVKYTYKALELTQENYSAYKYYIYNTDTEQYELDKGNFDQNETYYDKIAGNLGLVFDAQKATFKTPTFPSFATQYCENSYVEIETEIWPKVEDKTVGSTTIYGDRFLMFWVDGVPAGVKPYSYDTSFALQDTAPIIEIGSDLCDVCVYVAKAYERKLSFDEHLDNFIMDAPSAIKMMERYRRNDIIDNNGEISYEKLIKANPQCHAYLYDIPRLTTSKDDKVDDCTYYELIGDYNTLDNPYYRAEKVRTYVQGTSSAAYGVAAFNLRSDFTKKGTIYDAEGKEKDGWQRTPDDLPIDIACTKVNVASCENANNVVNQEWYNRFQPYWDAHRRKGYAVDEKGNLLYNPYRDTMGFHSGVIFIRDHNTETNYLDENKEPKTALALKANTFFDDTSYVNNPFFKMYSIGNMGNDKKNLNVYHDLTNPYASCVEVLDNQNAEHWMTVINEDAFEEKVIGYDEDGKEIVEGPYYEFRYGLTENEDLINNAEGITEAVQKEHFMRFVRWMARNDPHPYDAELHPYGYTGEKLVDEDGNDAPVTFADDFVFQGFNPPGYENSANPSGISLKGQKITKYKGTYTHDTKEYRIAKMLYECENYMIMDSVVFHYLYILRHTMVDNVAKNTFWSTEDGIHWDLTRDYDNDTSDGNDNTGNLTYTYGLEYGDLNANGKDVFNATPSVWIAFIHELYDAQQYLYKELEKKGAWNVKNYLAEFDKHQSIIPERCWLADYQRKYLRPRQLGLDQQTYLDRLEGGRKTHQRTQFETYQNFYINSKYVASTDFTDGGGLEFRLNKDPAESWDPNNILPISFYIDCYATIHLGGQIRTSSRLKRKQIYNVPVGQMVEAPNDATCFIYGASMIQSMSGFDKLYPGYAKLNGANKLLSIELGSNEQGYYNARMKEVSAGSNTMLQKFQMRNAGATEGDQVFGPLTLDKASRLNELLISGSAVKELVLAKGASTEILELNALATLNLSDLINLKTVTVDEGIYNSILNVYVQNCPKLDPYTYKFAKATQIERYQLSDFHWIIESAGDDYELSNDFAMTNEQVTGILAVDNLMKEDTLPKDGYTPATALTGKITINTPCNINEYDLYEKYIVTYPNLLIEYGDNMTEENGFKSAIELLFLKVQDSAEQHYRVLSNGSIDVATSISANGPTKIAMTVPSKEPTISETFVFSGFWIDKNDPTKKYYDPNTLAPDVDTEGAISFAGFKPTQSMTFYPDYDINPRQYLVRCYDWTPEIITQIGEENSYTEWPVDYNTKYNGPMKNYYYRDSSDLNEYSRYNFLGWSTNYYENGLVSDNNKIEYVDLENLTITNNINLYACYKIEDVRGNATSEKYFDFMKVSDGYGISIKDNYRNILTGKITLPSYYNGEPITIIGNASGNYGFQNTTNITHVFFMDDAKYQFVGARAFEGSTIKYIDLPLTITSIGNSAFKECVHLETITLNDNITEIGTYAFMGIGSGVNELMKVKIEKLPQSLKVLGQQAFCYGGPKITITTLPPDLTELKIFTFNNCDNICITSIPASITLDDSALSHAGRNYANENLQVEVLISADSIELAKTKIGEEAFSQYLGGTNNSNLRYSFPNMSSIDIASSELPSYWGLSAIHVQDQIA